MRGVSADLMIYVRVRKLDKREIPVIQYKGLEIAIGSSLSSLNDTHGRGDFPRESKHATLNDRNACMHGVGNTRSLLS